MEIRGCLRSRHLLREYSISGLTELRRYPRLDWTWNNISTARGPQHPDCLNLKQELTAQEFVKYIMGVLQMAYVRDALVPPQVIAAKQKFLDQLNAQSAANSRILKMEGTVQTAGVRRGLRPIRQRVIHDRSARQYRSRLHSHAATCVQPQGRIH